jgi:signal peptide peptidase SppA
MKILDLLTAPWSISREKHLEMVEIYLRHLKGDKIDFKSFAATFGEVKEEEYTVVNNKAIIPIKGVLVPANSFFSFFFDGTSLKKVKTNIQKALKEGYPLILDINSSGGTVEGAFELADYIFEVAQNFPVIAFSDGAMQSGAMLIASAANRRYVTGKTNLIGSIGVLARIEKSLNSNVEEYVSGKYKNIGSPYKKTTDFDRAEIQGQVDYLFSIFVSDISDRLGLSKQEIIDMEGRTYIGAQAIEAGLVDGVSTLENLIALEDFSTIIKGGGMSDKKMNYDEFKALNSEFSSLLKKEGKDEGLKEYKERSEKSVIAEQARILAIQAAAFPGQDALVMECIKENRTVGEAAILFNQLEMQKGAQVQKVVKQEAPKPVLKKEPDVVVKKEPLKTPEELFASSESLQKEFGDVGVYKAFLSAEKRNQLNIFGAATMKPDPFYIDK